MEKEEFTQRIKALMPKLKEMYQKRGPGPDYGKLHVEEMRKIKFD